MIILRTPKGWTGPKEVDGLKTEGSWRSHQVPLANLQKDPQHLQMLEQWLKSYRPEELFDDTGKLIGDVAVREPIFARIAGAFSRNGGDARRLTS